MGVANILYDHFVGFCYMIYTIKYILETPWGPYEKHKHIGLQLTCQYGIITLLETWLSAGIPNDVYNITGYHPLFRRDSRTNTKGGGVSAGYQWILTQKVTFILGCTWELYSHTP